MISGMLYFENNYQGSKFEHTPLHFLLESLCLNDNDSEAKQIEQIRDMEEVGEEASR